MITVIGGSGFIGTRLCKLFDKKGLAFKIVDKINSQTFENKTILSDVTNKEALLNIDLDSSSLINLAAEHKDNVSPKSLYHEVNVNGAINVCELADKNKINTIIFTSSVAVYGFAEVGTNENGKIEPFNEYGKTKFAAEKIYIDWQKKDQFNRKLIIIRPTVVFGEQNRGNVYNLFKSIKENKFLMVGSGKNLKSMAYVENLCSFIDFSLNLDVGIHTYNYVDKPDMDMNSLVKNIKLNLGKSGKIRIRLPYLLGLIIGYIFDVFSFFTKVKFPISAIRVEKFCKNSSYNSSIEKTSFSPPVELSDAIKKTIRYEFIDKKKGQVFYSE